MYLDPLKKENITFFEILSEGINLYVYTNGQGDIFVANKSTDIVIKVSAMGGDLVVTTQEATMIPTTIDGVSAFVIKELPAFRVYF